MKKNGSGNPAWVRWYASDAYSGTYNLTAVEECAYRRILDLIFISDDNLRDDDRTMATNTKAGRQWKVVKARLIELGKIEVVNGFIRNARATETCVETRTFRAQKVAAAVASHAPGKRLLNKQVGSAGADGSQPVPQLREGCQPTANKEEPPTGAAPAAEAGSPLPEAEPTPPSARQALFGEGLRKMVEMTGEAERSLRSWLGKGLKVTGDDPVPLLEAIQAAHRRWLAREPLADPRAWVSAAVRGRERVVLPKSREVPVEAGNWIVAEVVEECCRIMHAAGDGAWKDFSLTVATVLAEGADPDAHIYPVMRKAARRGLATIDGAGWFAFHIRQRHQGLTREHAA